MPIAPISPYAIPTADDLPDGRVSWEIRADRAALLVHDMQEYFVRAFTPEREPLTTAVAQMRRLLAAARAADVPVIYSAQPGDQDPAERQLLCDFWGAGPGARAQDLAIIDALTPLPAEPVMTKWRYSAFQRTDLRPRLRELGRDQLIVTGIYAHIGCMMTAADAFMQDVQPFLVADATADFSREEHLSALRWTAARCGRVVMTDVAVDQLRTRRPSRMHVRV